MEINMNREIWEGWTVKDFIDALSGEIEMIMSGNSWRKPFRTRPEMCLYIMENQPYCKKPIIEVFEYFIKLYGLE